MHVIVSIHHILHFLEVMQSFIQAQIEIKSKDVENEGFMENQTKEKHKAFVIG